MFQENKWQPDKMIKNYFLKNTYILKTGDRTKHQESSWEYLQPQADLNNCLHPCCHIETMPLTGQWKLPPRSFRLTLSAHFRHLPSYPKYELISMDNIRQCQGVVHHYFIANSLVAKALILLLVFVNWGIHPEWDCSFSGSQINIVDCTPEIKLFLSCDILLLMCQTL